jgi:manganese transport protein
MVFFITNKMDQWNNCKTKLQAEGYLGFENRAKGIARIVKATKADMLVVGAHGHTGLRDFIYGETVDSVRHELKIPVLIVHL